jgi:type I restriction enzyme M protein
MIDARSVYRQVTRKICDFSPEQLKNLSSIVWLYHGQQERFLKLVEEYLDTAVAETKNTFNSTSSFFQKLANLLQTLDPFLKTLPNGAVHIETFRELLDAQNTFTQDIASYNNTIEGISIYWKSCTRDNAGLQQMAEKFAPVAEQSRDLIKQVDLLYKMISRLIDICEKELEAKGSNQWTSRHVNNGQKGLDEVRKEVVEQLKLVYYFYKQAQWLQKRFPDAELRDVEGLVNLVDNAKIKANDWSLTPGRYVGVAPEEVDDDFDFDKALREIHVELQSLNEEAVELAIKIATNFEGLGI